MGKAESSVSTIYMCIPITRYAVVTVSLPALSLAYCFISAFLFRHDDVNDSDCTHLNHSIPSISGVTGIKPQAYIWRICVGLHSAPRFFVGIMHFNYYTIRLPNVEYKKIVRFLMSLCFWLYSIECFCLLAVSCVSNKENYPLHEKIFVMFMVTSIANMVFHTILFKLTRYKTMTELEERSYFWKKIMLLIISLSTVGLLCSFVQHKFYCLPGAFSKFSTCEYLIAYSNIGYHFTAMWDFSGVKILAASLNDAGANGSARAVNGTEIQTNGSAKPARVAVENGKRKHE